MTVPQIISAVAGGSICIASLIYYFLNRSRLFKSLFWLAVGGAMVFAGFRPQLIESLGQDSIELRVRLLVAFLSFIVLTITLEAIRIGRMQERYAFLWLATGAALFIGSVMVKASDLVEKATGMHYVATAMIVLFTFLMLMLFHFSVALSRMQQKLSQLARALAMAEERLRRLEGSSKKPEDNEKD